MDNFLIFIIIACVIVWWDSKKRKKARSKIWKDVGLDEPVKKDSIVYKFPPRQEIIDTPKMDVQEELKDFLAVLKQVMDKQANDELTKMPSKEIIDAKSALKALGYKNGDINKAVDEITNTKGSNMKSGEIVISALRILSA